jgi:diguanylate cyclase (GGDEF)-like protein/PAS domain S-box-containing protein
MTSIFDSEPPEAMPPSTRQLEDLFYPHRKALAELTHADALRRGDVAAALELVTEVASQVLRVERASVWRYQEERRALECSNLFERTPRKHSRGESLLAASFPRYFAALAEERTIAASNAHTDERTSEFSAPYLTPHGISSMLDAPVFVRGRMIGVVCHEHVGVPRRWQRWEELVAGSVADFVALAIEAAERTAVEEQLVRHKQELEGIVAARTAELTKTNADLEREIAERLRVEARLLHSEANLRHLFEISPVTLVLSRISDQRVMLANRRSLELFELREDEVVGQRTPDYYVDPTDRARLLARVREEGRVQAQEAMLKTKNGREFTALLSAQPLVFEGEPALLVSAIDISSQKAIESQLRILATRDALTDCLNRRHFLETASAEIERAIRYRHPVSVAMLDADRFKNINDTFGHDVGDQALRAIADGCRGTLRKSDLLGRLGGEEFAILLVETGLAEVESSIGRVVNAVAALVLERNGTRVPVGVSADVTERRENERLAPLLRRADEALYRAKQEGRNRVAKAS